MYYEQNMVYFPYEYGIVSITGFARKTLQINKRKVG